MKNVFRLILIACFYCASAIAQQPILSYEISVKSEETSGVQITIRLRNLPQTFHLAMVRHFLVDDGYWRFVEDLQTSSGSITREEDGLWRLMGASKDILGTPSS